MTEYYRYTGERAVSFIFLLGAGIALIVKAFSAAGIMLAILGMYKLIFLFTYNS